MKIKKSLLLLFVFICFSLSVRADSSFCACCAEPGEYSISTKKPAAAELEILRKLRFATANLYTNAAYPDNIRGISSPLGDSYSIDGLFQNRAWRLNFRDDRNRTGMLELPLSATMVEYMVDMDHNEAPNRQTILYKEWRFKFRVRRGDGIFLGGLRNQPATEYFLVLQGRGNNCTTAEDFKKWRLEITGKKAGYAFYGNLKNE